MATVRRIVEQVAAGVTALQDAERDFETRPWPQPPQPTPEQLSGVHDMPPSTDNSVDWIELEPDLSDAQREALRMAYDRAQRG